MCPQHFDFWQILNSTTFIGDQDHPENFENLRVGVCYIVPHADLRRGFLQKWSVCVLGNLPPTTPILGVGI